MPIFPLLLATQLYENAGANGLQAAEADNSFNCFLMYLTACAMKQRLNSQNRLKL